MLRKKADFCTFLIEWNKKYQPKVHTCTMGMLHRGLHVAAIPNACSTYAPAKLLGITFQCKRNLAECRGTDACIRRAS